MYFIFIFTSYFLKSIYSLLYIKITFFRKNSVFIILSRHRFSYCNREISVVQYICFYVHCTDDSCFCRPTEHRVAPLVVFLFTINVLFSLILSTRLLHLLTILSYPSMIRKRKNLKFIEILVLFIN